MTEPKIEAEQTMTEKDFEKNDHQELEALIEENLAHEIFGLVWRTKIHPLSTSCFSLSIC